MKQVITLLAIVSMLLTGCLKNWDEDEYTFGETRELGVMNMYPGALTQEGAFSIPLNDDESLWVFGETLLADSSEIGFHALSNSAGIHRGRGAPVGDALEWITDSSGNLKQLIPYNDFELEWNSDPNAPYQYRLWPIGGVRIGEFTYIFVLKAGMVSYFDVSHWYSFLVRLDESLSATRLSSFGMIWGYGARLDEDGYIYMQGKEARDNPDYAGFAGRFRQDSIEFYEAYEFYNCDDRWSHLSFEACRSSWAPNTSIASNAYLDAYIVIRSYYWENSIWFAKSRRQYIQDYGFEFPVSVAFPPRNFWIKNLYQHPEYERDGGKTILISYWSQQEESGPGLHLTEFEFYDR